jgi:hypothetical protein
LTVVSLFGSRCGLSWSVFTVHRSTPHEPDALLALLVLADRATELARAATRTTTGKNRLTIAF